MPRRDVLLDVSRLIWRLWRGGLPTGVDRVCLAYVDHFRARSRAVIQRRGRYFVLSEKASDRLFDLICSGPAGFRGKFVRLALTALPLADRRPREKGMAYLNVGHTGLDEPSLGAWIADAEARAIFLIHDLIPIVHPEYCRPGEQAKHEKRIANAVSIAAGVIANSQETLGEIEEFATRRGLRMPPATVAPIAGPPIPGSVVPKKFGRPHFVIVGTIEARKNHEMLLDIWRRMAASEPEPPLLIVVGQRGWESERAIAMLDDAAMFRGSVMELGRCSDDELASIIAGARALLMPSFAEGFGLPVVEALELGTPVIASDLPVFREIAGDIPTYLDQRDAPGWEEMIKSFLDDGPERQRQLDRILGYRAPDWPTHFKIVDGWIETLFG